MSRKLTNEEFIERSRKVHGDKYDYSLVEYINIYIKVKIICKKHGIFEQKPSGHQLGNGCVLCFGNIKLTTESFIERSRKVHGDKYDYSLVEYVNYNTKVKIIYNECIYEQLPNNHLKGFVCENIKKMTKEEFIQKSKEIHGDKYDYSLVDFKNVRGKVKLIYNEVVYEQYAYVHLQGNSPKGIVEFSSKGEKSIEKYLITNKIKYKKQHWFSDCRNILPLPFDFYLEDYNILIEYDGEQHFRSVVIFGGDDGFKRLQHNDNIKNKYCEQNRIPLLRISYLENINEKLSNYLESYLKL